MANITKQTLNLLPFKLPVLLFQPLELRGVMRAQKPNQGIASGRSSIEQAITAHRREAWCEMPALLIGPAVATISSAMCFQPR